MSKLGRRKFLLYGSTGLAAGLFLKGCAGGSDPSDTSTDASSPAPSSNGYVPETKGYGCDWIDPSKGGKYKI